MSINIFTYMLKLFQTPYTESDLPPIVGTGNDDSVLMYLGLAFIALFLYFVLAGGAGK